MNEIKTVLEQVKGDMLAFAQALVRTKSFTGKEEAVIKLVRKKMLELGYDDVIVDGIGNVVGVIGSGEKKLLFDSHVDTVGVKDEKQWSVAPFGGGIIDGRLYGRGSADMKSAVAATVYAGYAVKQLGLDKDKTIYVSASVMEEDYDGETLLYELTEGGIRPDYVVICEATRCELCLGQRGRALIRIDIKGVSAHGSAPEKGDNPVYKAAELIRRIEKLGARLIQTEGEKGSLALTNIECEAASLNAIPSKCSIYIDRRLVKGEDSQYIKKEMDELLLGIGASWEVYQVIGKSWTGKDVVLDSFMPAWEIDAEHELARAAVRTYETLNGKKPEFVKWDFSTNGVASATRLGIPTMGFGPGDSKLAHCNDEYCPVEDISKAFEFYVNLVKNI